jgi:hypothetical protein
MTPTITLPAVRPASAAACEPSARAGEDDGGADAQSRGARQRGGEEFGGAVDEQPAAEIGAEALGREKIAIIAPRPIP